MTAVVYARAMAVLSAVAFLIAAWRLVVNAVEGNWGWAAGMAACCVMDAVVALYFAQEARR